jgi:secondary thiamine-phosphate synthase enzyme
VDNHTLFCKNDKAVSTAVEEMGNVMSWLQKTIRLKPRSRGFHLITDEIVGQTPELRHYHVGLAHLFLLHTSAALALNEDADPTVRQDLESHFNQMVPENAPYYRHTYEGSDDMPAHIKSVLLGNSLTIPMADGNFKLGTWQGIYLCEHRNRAGSRQLVVTLHGEEFEGE